MLERAVLQILNEFRMDLSRAILIISVAIYANDAADLGATIRMTAIRLRSDGEKGARP